MKLAALLPVGAVALALVATPAPSVTPGIDVLREERGKSLAGRRVGLITNHTGVAIDGTPALTLFREELGLHVVALYSPEHGFGGDVAAGDEIASTRDRRSGIPIYSLYGENRAPAREMLSGVDTLVFDVQDVGVRFFTYASTMKLAMEAAASAGIDFVVLDRPNPNGGLRVEGPVLEPEFASFVGIAPIALLHGMTVGELARFFQASEDALAPLKLTVIAARGWTRDMMWNDTGLRWRPPSPNLRSPRSAYAYPALGLLEGVEVSEGRGTEETFEKFGAPWIEEKALADSLRRRGLRGIQFRPTSFVPRSIPAAPRPRFQDELCRGVAVEVDEPREFEPVRTGLATIEELRSLFPRSFRWVKRGERHWIDLLLGSDRPRRGLDAGRRLDEILDAEEEAVERFVLERRSHLLY